MRCIRGRKEAIGRCSCHVVGEQYYCKEQGSEFVVKCRCPLCTAKCECKSGNKEKEN